MLLLPVIAKSTYLFSTVESQVSLSPATWVALSSVLPFVFLLIGVSHILFPLNTRFGEGDPKTGIETCFILKLKPFL